MRKTIIPSRRNSPVAVVINTTDVRRSDSRIETAIVSSYYESFVEDVFIIVFFLLYIQPFKSAVLIGILHHNLIEINIIYLNYILIKFQFLVF